MGLSVELSDTRRLGSRHCPTDASEARSRYPGDNASRSRWRGKDAGESTRGTGVRPKPHETRRIPPECKTRLASAPQRGGAFLGEADSTGPRPESVYAYAERSRGRRRRPPRKVSTVAPKQAARYEGTARTYIKTSLHRRRNALHGCTRKSARVHRGPVHGCTTPYCTRAPTIGARVH